MPFCDVDDRIKIFYKRFGHGNTKVLLIIGLAGTHDSWGPQVKALTGAMEFNDPERLSMAGVNSEELTTANEEGNQDDGIEVCCFDNRGMGKSSVPTNKSEYSTTIMAKDALALLDHLCWKRAHVFGHSMGGMIACKLAAIAPNRICSLALLNVTGGGYECFPKIDRQMLSLAVRFLRARTPEQRAHVDLETHYTKEYLDEYVGTCTRRSILFLEYVKAISASGMQSKYGFEGQVNACWTHKMTSEELDTIRSSGFLISVIHGSSDIIARLDHARRLAEKLQPAARMVEITGGHLVSHERPDEVNAALIQLINASKLNLKPDDWSYLPEKQMGWLVSRISSTDRLKLGENSLQITYYFLAKLQFTFIYIVGIIFMLFEHMRNIVKIVKPVKVAPSYS